RRELEAVPKPTAGAVRDVAIVYNLLGDLSLREGDPAAALTSYREGLKRSERLYQAASKNPVFRQGLAISHEKIGTALLRQGQSPAARQSYDKALEILRPLAAEEPDNLGLAANLTLVLARSGIHAEAAERAADLRRLAPQYTNNLYNVACCYALCR